MSSSRDNNVIINHADSEPFDIIADENQILYGNGIGNIYDRTKNRNKDPLREYQDRDRRIQFSERSAYISRVNQLTNRIKSGSTQITKLAGDIDPANATSYYPQYTIAFKILSDAYENRLANCMFFDDVVNAAVNRLAFFVLGNADELRANLYPNTPKKLLSQAEAYGELQQVQMVRSGINIGGSILNNSLTLQEIQDLEKTIHYVDYTCNLPSIIEHNWKNSFIFGRSASLLEFTPDPIDSLNIPAQMPIAAKPLKSQYLGNVLIDPTSWEISAVQYKDPKIDFLHDMYVDPFSTKKQVQDSRGKPVNEFDPAPPATASNWGYSSSVRPGVSGTSPQEDPLSSQGAENSQFRFIDSDYLLYFVRNNNNMMKDDDDFYFGHSALQSILSLSEENRRINRIVLPQLNQSHWAGSGLFSAPNWNVEQMSMLLSGFKPGGYSAVNQTGLNFQEIKLTHDYAGLLAQQDYIKKRILSVIGIPSFLMNFEDITNRATVEIVLSAFSESNIQAERSWICKILDDQWYPRILRAKFPQDDYANIKLKVMLEFSNITFESFLEKAAALNVLVQSGFIPLDVAQNMLQLPTAMNKVIPQGQISGQGQPQQGQSPIDPNSVPPSPQQQSTKSLNPSLLLNKYLGSSF